MAHSSGRKAKLLPFLACLLLCLLTTAHSFAQPVINRFYPQNGAVGDTVRIYGSGFTGTSNVRFGGTAAASFGVINDTMIVAILGNGNSGDVWVMTAQGTHQLGWFKFDQPAPVIYGRVLEEKPMPGEVFYLRARNIYNAVIVTNCSSVSALRISDTLIEVRTVRKDPVCNIARFEVRVGTPGGQLTYIVEMDMAINRKPVVNSMTPSFGGKGTVLIIKGDSLRSVANVEIKDRYRYGNATILTRNDSMITASVDDDATWGRLILTNYGRISTEFPTFTFSNAAGRPFISYVYSGGPDTTAVYPNSKLTIIGANLNFVKKITLGADTVKSFRIISDSKIEAVVGSVKNFDGTVNIYDGDWRDFLTGVKAVRPLYPSIKSFTPERGRTGDTVYIYGHDLDYTTTVMIGGSTAASFVIVNDTMIKAIVGTGGSGSVGTHGSNGGGTYASTSFTYIPDNAPVIISFSPASGTRNDFILIKGHGLEHVREVSIGGIPVSQFFMTWDGMLARPGKGITTTNTITVKSEGGTHTASGFTLINLPAADSIVPRKGYVGDTLTIYGTGLNLTTLLKMGYQDPYNVSVPFRIINDSIIKVVATYAASGWVVPVNADGGDSSMNAFFQLLPEVKSFSPQTGEPGTEVVIKGTFNTGAWDYSRVYQVSIGGVPAQFTQINDSTIHAVAGNGATGPVVVQLTNSNPFASGENFVFPGPGKPIITSFTPTSGYYDDSVVIRGTGFTGATAASIGRVPVAYLYVYDDSTAGFHVGVGKTGFVSITTPRGTDSTATRFTYLYKQPEITAFRPEAARKGEMVQIYGSNMEDVTAVYFGGVRADSFRVVNSRIEAWPGEGASGAIRLESPAGTDSMAGFTYKTPKPVISSFSPKQGRPGTVITINGTNLNHVTSVGYALASEAVSFKIISPTKIEAVVGNAAAGAPMVWVRSADWLDTLGTFQWLPPLPEILAVAPDAGRRGDTVRITGQYFKSTTAVHIGGAPVSILGMSDSVITARVANSAVNNASVTSAYVVVTTLYGKDTALFTIYYPPVVTSVHSAAAAKDETVIIRGSNFTGATAVRFGGVPAKSFTVVSAAQINAVVDTGATGKVMVVTPGGVDTSVAFTFQPPQPEIIRFIPTSGTTGDTIIIYGDRFRNVSEVRFGAVPARILRTYGDSLIYVVLQAGATGAVEVVSSYGTDSLGGFVFKAPPQVLPVITSFTPANGYAGDSIVVKGRGFTGTTQVTVGGVPAQELRVYNDSAMWFKTGAGATGKIAVTTAAGTTASAASFTFITRGPRISICHPNTAGKGDSVVIGGERLSGVTSVTFGGVAADSFHILSDAAIRVWVGNGRSGYVKVSTGLQADSLYGFTWMEPTVPVIASYLPTEAGPGFTVVIKGRAFMGTTAVSLGGTAAASFQVISDSVIHAVVAVNAYSVPVGITVTTPGGTAVAYGFSILARPIVTSVTPSRATVGDTVIIRGTGLYNTSAVSFGGKPAASFVVDSYVQVNAVVGNGATGRLTVTTNVGRDSSLFFTYLPPVPLIRGFYPATGWVGDTVNIYGKRFTEVTKVELGSDAGAAFRIVNDTLIKVVVRSAMANGYIYVYNSNGLDTSAGRFVFSEAKLALTRFSPQTATTGETVNIYGNNFTDITGVFLGGVAADSFRVVSAQEITAWVGTGGTGAVKVTGAKGTDSLAGFTFRTPAPQIVSFAPAAANPGKTVVITGRHFKGAIAVRIGDALATSFMVITDSVIHAVVSNAANNNTGTIMVTTAGGKDTAYGFTVLPPGPLVTSLSPSSATLGETVIIRGTALAGATSVRFGNRPAASFVVVSATQINAVVDSGATGKVTVVTLNGVDTSVTFTYLQPAPAVRRFAPQQARTGDTVYIYGTRLNATSSVRFGMLEARSYQVINDTLVKAVVGLGASGNVTVTTRYGAAQLNGFIYPGLPPVIYSFTPESGARGEIVKIRGAHFAQATVVMLGNFAPASFSVESDSIIHATIGAGDANAGSQQIAVETPGGIANASGFTYIDAGVFNLSAFRVVAGNERVLISWKTNGEKYTDHFRLLWTAGSETVLYNNVPAAGFSDTAVTYAFAYPLSKSGKNLLQLTMYDKMGNVFPGDTASFMVEAEKFANINTYPNPAVSYTTVQHPASAGQATIMMFNMNGTLVQTATVKAGDVQTTIYFNSLPKGMYKMVWTNGSASKTSTILLQ